MDKTKISSNKSFGILFFIVFVLIAIILIILSLHKSPIYQKHEPTLEGQIQALLHKPWATLHPVLYVPSCRSQA